MKGKFTISIALITACVGLTKAQFVPAFADDQLPMNQPCEATKLDGTIVKGVLKGAMQMNGKLKSFAIAPDGGGDKQKFKAEDVTLVKMKPSNMQKIAEAAKAAQNINKMKDVKNIIDCDWIYYETVKMPNSDKSFLAQRLNPGENNNKLKVYQDPNAKQEASAGFGGMTLTGGKDKSYFILTEGGSNSILAEKKKYKEQMVEIFKNCPQFMTDLNGDSDWGNFPNHVAFYNYSCK